MSNANHQNKSSKTKIWTSYVFSALPVIFMLMSSTMKLSHAPMVIEGMAKNGISPGVVTIIGIVELLCVVIYLLPGTTVLGAVLMTGYLGGAIMVHVGAGEAKFVIPLLFGMMAWGGLYLRDERIRALLPLRKHAHPVASPASQSAEFSFAGRQS
jgi:hypothetical protein